MWKHKTKFKGKTFFGNRRFNKKTQQDEFWFENSVTGTEVAKKYKSYQQAKADGWVKYA